MKYSPSISRTVPVLLLCLVIIIPPVMADQSQTSHRASIKAIAGGGWHSLALKEDGTVVAWGNNEFGQTTVPGD